MSDISYIKKKPPSEYSPCAGENTFKYKQSSDWFIKKGSKRFRYSSRPFGILSKAAVSLFTFGTRWGHTGLNLSAIRTPSHGEGVRVGLNLEREREREGKNEWWGKRSLIMCGVIGRD